MKNTRPFQVSTFGLSPDLKRVHPAFGTINRGEVSRHTLFDALEIYRRIDPNAAPSESHFLIKSELGRFIVRVAGGQLTLAAENERTAQAVPLAPEEIVTRLEKPHVEVVMAPPPPPEPRWRIAVSAVLVLAGVALLIRGLKPLLVPEPAAAAEDISIITDLVQVNAQQRAVAGIFATGDRPGDRRLTISANGYIEFAELGPRQNLGSGTDTFEIGRREAQTCLVTARNGVITIVNANTLRYYGDTYRRLE